MPAHKNKYLERVKATDFNRMWAVSPLDPLNVKGCYNRTWCNKCRSGTTLSVSFLSANSSSGSLLFPSKKMWQIYLKVKDQRSPQNCLKLVRRLELCFYIQKSKKIKISLQIRKSNNEIIVKLKELWKAVFWHLIVKFYLFCHVGVKLISKFKLSNSNFLDEKLKFQVTKMKCINIIWILNFFIFLL